ncbi:protein-tyrosine phosphatase-like protein [Polychytrium aggregatum]|uniref:protein-tyrosine phosphatase-like protein n=1 Tax=Polychytrium aggregatum TaxID=110093 RepID=UPI0022FDB167|nr:protein-tyrosine phosphatase-like protein [Polychytrium aggregatum]KAI9206066.1 protein-tyrosine phosphatase-like protein [Polychytrium aggregatum]
MPPLSLSEDRINLNTLWAFFDLSVLFTAPQHSPGIPSRGPRRLIRRSSQPELGSSRKQAADQPALLPQPVRPPRPVSGPVFPAATQPAVAVPETVSYYPADERLPRHFSWIDDGMIAGMSIPDRKCHWSALVEIGVGLVVNTTESLIAGRDPNGGIRCMKCSYQDTAVDPDVFELLEPESEMKVLFLPVHDGSVPTWSQLRQFVKSSKETIAKGKKVAVHCKAGVGRTGIFLAVYLMEKYQCTAAEALKSLRRIRPQSLQFHPQTWVSDDPFSHTGEYVRNRLQEHFLERYWTIFIRPTLSQSEPGMSTMLPPSFPLGRGILSKSPTRPAKPVPGASDKSDRSADGSADSSSALQKPKSIYLNRSRSNSSPVIPTPVASDSTPDLKPLLGRRKVSFALKDSSNYAARPSTTVDPAVEQELEHLLRSMESADAATLKTHMDDIHECPKLCFVCKGTLSLGPYPVSRNHSYPTTV